MMDVIADSGRQLCGEAGAPVDAAVVAVAGRIDRETGTVLQSANLPFVDYPLSAELSKRLGGASVRIEHDAACGLVGETVRGAARGFDNVIYLTVSTGISVGILIDGVVLNGAHGVAGELGHTPVASPGVPCPCGSWGCLEAYASGRAFAELGSRAAADGSSPALAAVLGAQGEITAKDLLVAARQGDQVSAEIVDNAVHLLPAAIRLLLMTLDPHVLVVGGGVMSNPYFADRISRARSCRATSLTGYGWPSSARAASCTAAWFFSVQMTTAAVASRTVALPPTVLGRNDLGREGSRLTRCPFRMSCQPHGSCHTPTSGNRMRHSDLNVAVLTRHRYQELELWYPAASLPRGRGHHESGRSRDGRASRRCRLPGDPATCSSGRVRFRRCSSCPVARRR